MMINCPHPVHLGAILGTALLIIAPGIQAQTVVRMHGAVTMEKLFSAQKQPIESKTGAKLELVGSGSGRGLANLSAGLADVAMIGGSLKGVADATNLEKAGSVDLTGMKAYPLTAIKLAIITHPGVGLKAITAGQLREVLSGKTRNWKEVGGADVPVKVILPFLGDGARISIQESLLQGTTYTKEAILRNSSKDMGKVVEQVAGACTFVTIKNIEGNVAVLNVDQDLVMPMQLVIKGEPNATLQKVLDEAKVLIK